MTVSTHRLLTVCVLLLCGALLPSCSIHWNDSRYRAKVPSVLKRVELEPEGSERREYELTVKTFGEARVRETVTDSREVAFLGITTHKLNGELAAELGVPAWNGVLIDRVVDGSAASDAGLLKGDILLSLDSQEVTTSEQVTELIQDGMKPGQEIGVRVQRWAEPDPDGDVRLIQREFNLTVGSRAIESSSTRVHKLPSSASVLRHTGMNISELPQELASVLFQVDREVVLVSRVVPGSPAYLAGFRAGDRITSVDVVDVESLDQVRAAVLQCAISRGFSVNQEALLGTNHPISSASGNKQLVLSVEGPLGPWTESVVPVQDIEDDSEFYFPILFSYDSETKSTDWSFLHFIFQLGATYDSHFVHSATRRSESVTDLSLLPLGLIEYSRSPVRTRWTLLWFISFSI